MRLLPIQGSFAAAAALSLQILSSSASAQQSIALPGITVQGATLETGRVQRAPLSAAPSPSSQVGGDTTAASEETALGVPIDTIGNAVTVVTGEELRRQQVRTAAEALRGLPGVAVSQPGGVGSFTQVRIRGAEANHTLVLIDGIEANNTTDGEFDFSNLSAEDIERIEVIRGPMSSLHGSNAVGGVVNIITRRGRGPMTASFRVETGSFATNDIVARLSGGNDQANLSISAERRRTDGFNIAPSGGERDGSELNTLSLRAGVRLMENMVLDVSLRNMEKRAARDGFGDLSNAPVGSLAQAFDDKSTLANHVFLAGANLKWDMLSGALSHEFRANHNGTTTQDRDRTFFSESKNISTTDTFAYAATYRFDTPAIWAKHSLSALVERQDEQFTPEGTFADGRTRDRGRFSYAGEWRGGFADRLYLTAGVRRDDNEEFSDTTTWRLAASLPLAELGMRPHASVGTAVKLPTMFEQFGTDQFFSPNPGLQPEKSFGWDAGIEFTLPGGRATLDITYFNADLTDKIKGFVATAIPGVFTAVNLPGESTRQGVEIAARVKLASNLSWGAAYTFTNARDADGQAEARRPPHSARTDLGYTFGDGRGSASIGVIYNGRSEDIAFLIPSFNQLRVGLDPYWVVNAAASYKLQPGVELFARVENLLDQKYQEAFGFDAAPIAAFAGVKLTLGGPDGLGGSWAK
jgi:vitamin B12 transporter